MNQTKIKMKKLALLLVLLGILGFFLFMKLNSPSLKWTASSDPKIKIGKPELKEDSIFKNHEKYISDGFDFPVGPPDAKEYYNAQKFTENNHLGEDWNAVTGGDSDLGDPIFAISHGVVSRSYDAGSGWGNIIRILHKTRQGKYIESLYAHCDQRLVKKGDWIKRGDTIGTIGNANGVYLAHLHFELRTDPKMNLGLGYSSNTEGYISPTDFIRDNRPIN